MPTKKAIGKAVAATSRSAATKASKEPEVEEARAVSTGDAAPSGDEPSTVASDALHEPRIGTAVEPSEPIPNVQAEPQHASQAPEDVRDAQVATPNPTTTGPVKGDAVVEAYGGGVFECSLGDFITRSGGAEAVEEHIAEQHGTKKGR